MSKLITVFGATGNQGGSVIDYILNDPQLSKEYKIRGITRDTTKRPAQELAARGVELATANLNSTESLQTALKDSHTVFLVTNYWETADGELEYQQGRNVTDVAKQLGVTRIIFSSLHHVTKESRGRLTHVPHFDSKANIERYIRDSGLECTFFMPGWYMSNLNGILRKGEDGVFQLAFPVGKDSKFPLFDAAHDTGLFVGAALKHASDLQGKQILAADAYYTPDEIVSTFTKVTGKKAVFAHVTAEQYKAALPPAMAEEMFENQLFVEDPGYYLGASLEPSHKLLDRKPTTWAEYVEKNAAVWA